MSPLHVSISANDPERVASFLATILGGRHLPFPPFPESRIAFSEKDDGAAVEVYPLTHRVIDGGDTIACDVGETDDGGTFVHLALQSPLSREVIREFAKSEGWLTRVCDRGPFECVEVWLEDRLLVEILDPDMQRDYRANMTMENWKSMFGL